MKTKFLAFFFALAMANIVPFTTYGDETVIDGVTWYYTPNGDGTAAITGGAMESGETLHGVVTIPSSVDGLAVTEIADVDSEPFACADFITSLTIPEGVTTIGEGAFNSCTSLETVNLPASLTTIGLRAFSFCDSLTSFELAENNTAFELKEGCLFRNGTTTLALYPSGRDTFEFSDVNVTAIGDGACYGCYSIAGVTIPDTVTEIGAQAFFSCPSLVEIVVPSSVTTIGDQAFASCGSFSDSGTVEKIHLPVELRPDSDEDVEAFIKRIFWYKHGMMEDGPDPSIVIWEGEEPGPVVATWIGGSGDYNWETATNWSTQEVPDSETDVVIPADAPEGGWVLYIGSSANAKSLTILANTTIQRAANPTDRGNVTVQETVTTGETPATLTLNSSNIFAGGSEVTISCPIVVANAETITAANKKSSGLRSNSNGTFKVDTTITGVGEFEVMKAATFSKDLEVTDGMTLSFAAQPTFTDGAVLMGTGTVVFSVDPSAEIKSMLQNDATWTGVCELKGAINGIDFNNFGNTKSTVRANGLSGYLAYPADYGTREIANVKVLDIGAGGLTLNNTLSKKRWTIAAKLTGTGTMTVGTASNPLSTYTFIGDVSEFEGVVSVGDAANKPAVIFNSSGIEPPVVAAGQIAIVDGTMLGVSGLSGTIVGDGEIRLINDAEITLDDEKWKGTVIIDWEISGGLNFERYGRNGSEVRIDRTMTGHLTNAAANGNPVCQATLRLYADTTINNGWPSRSIKPDIGRIAGMRNLTFDGSGNANWTDEFPFTADIDGTYSGKITIKDKFSLHVEKVWVVSNPDYGVRITEIVLDGGTLRNVSGEDMTTPGIGMATDVDGVTLVYQEDGKDGPGLYFDPVAIVEGDSYTIYCNTLAEAVGIAGTKTITLVRNTDEDVTLGDGQTLDVNGFAYSGKLDGAGTIYYAEKPTTLPTFDEHWTGTFVVDWDGGYATDELPLQSYGNFGDGNTTYGTGANCGKIEIRGEVGGYLPTNSYNGNIDVIPTVNVTGSLTVYGDEVNPIANFRRVTGDGAITFYSKYSGLNLDQFTGTLATDANCWIYYVNLASQPTAGEKLVKLGDGSSQYILFDDLTFTGVYVNYLLDSAIKVEATEGGIYLKSGEPEPTTKTLTIPTIEHTGYVVLVNNAPYSDIVNNQITVDIGARVEVMYYPNEQGWSVENDSVVIASVTAFSEIDISDVIVKPMGGGEEPPTPEPDEPTVAVDDSKMEEPVVDEETGVRTIAAKDGETLTQSDVESITITATIPGEASPVDTTAGYEKTLVGNEIVITLKTPEMDATVQEANKEEGDSTGMLADVDKVELSTEVPTPSEEDVAAGNTEVAALPVKSVRGLYYQASWGSSLEGMTEGQKVQATGSTLNLGVIKQKGSCGFYKLSVSEK